MFEAVFSCSCDYVDGLGRIPSTPKRDQETIVTFGCQWGRVNGYVTLEAYIDIFTAQEDSATPI